MLKFLFMGLYGAFVLAAAAILIFTGSTGRRLFALAAATGGVATFITRFLYSNMESVQLTLIQALIFPFLVLGTWAALFLFQRFKSR